MKLLLKVEIKLNAKDERFMMNLNNKWLIFNNMPNPIVNG
jgi:hypothetical protein